MTLNVGAQDAEQPPVSRGAAVEGLNQAFSQIERYISNSLLTEREKKSFVKSRNAMQESGKKIIAALPTRKNGMKFGKKHFNLAVGELSVIWSRFKEKANFVCQKDSAQLCADIIPQEHKRVSFLLDKIIDVTPQSQKKLHTEMKSQLSELFIGFEGHLNTFLEQMHKENEFQSAAKSFGKAIRRFRIQMTSNFEALFRVVALNDAENQVDAIFVSLDKMASAVDIEHHNYNLPDEIYKADQSLAMLLGEVTSPTSLMSLPQQERSTAVSFIGEKSEALASLGKVLFEKVEKMKIRASRSELRGATISSYASSMSSSSNMYEPDPGGKQKKIEEIEGEIQKVEVENTELQHQLTLLEASRYGIETLDDKVEAFIRSKIHHLDTELEKVQEGKRKLESKLTEDTIAFNTISQELREREANAKAVSARIEETGILNDNFRLEREKEMLANEFDKLSKQKEMIIQAIQIAEQKTQKAEELSQEVVEQIKELRHKGKGLQKEYSQKQDDLYKTRGIADGDPIMEVYDAIEIETQEELKLKKRKEELQNEIIPDLQASIQISSTELKRASSSLNSMQSIYQSKRLETIRGHLSELGYC